MTAHEERTRAAVARWQQQLGQAWDWSALGSDYPNLPRQDWQPFEDANQALIEIAHNRGDSIDDVLTAWGLANAGV